MRLGFIIISQRIKLSRQCVGPGFLGLKKFKAQPSAGKVMATVFWGAKCVIVGLITQEKYNNWCVCTM